MIGISMSAMAYREEFLGATTAKQPSRGPVSSDPSVRSERAAVKSFERPAVDVVSAAIPVVFIGRNRDGLWVARDAEGKFGGLFWRKESALRFAQRCAATTGYATVFPQARFELDIENAGNPLVGHGGSARRIVTRQLHRIYVAIRNRLRS